MAGRIRDEDVRRVREESRIEVVVGEYLQLRHAGGGNLKGLCPFHDERSPSFHVSPARGLYHCFGCQAGGDVISFVRQVEHLSFTEAVERLAALAGIQLRYEQSGYTRAGEQSDRTRLLAVHKVAAEFYREQLATPEAEPGRRFLRERGFDDDVTAHFAVGYAPAAWETLVRHLRGRGFSDAELVKAGVAREGRRGPVDRFRRRLIWPISDITGDVIGFGARRLAEDDDGPKYLNTPETPLYRKSTVLYGLHLAKRDIAKHSRAVVVEGYTDVMACHLAGVTTAIATCGTSFGEEHIRILRRLLMDRDVFRGQVVFTFDGDAAGQKAALRAFEEDQRFIAQTFVAVESSGMDPCELRLARGDAAVAALVERRVPLVEFAVRSVVDRYDVGTAEGRVAALREAAPLVAAIRDTALRPEYARVLAGWLDMDGDTQRVLAAVSRAARAREGQGAAAPRVRGAAGASASPARAREEPRRPAAANGPPAGMSPQEYQVQREALKIAVQRPHLAGASFDTLREDEFTAPAFRVARTAIAQAGGTAGAAAGRPVASWVAEILEHAPDDGARSLLTGLAVEPLRCPGEPDARYAGAQFARVRERSVLRHDAETRVRLRKAEAAGDADGVTAALNELSELQAYRHDLSRIFGTD